MLTNKLQLTPQASLLFSGSISVSRATADSFPVGGNLYSYCSLTFASVPRCHRSQLCHYFLLCHFFLLIHISSPTYTNFSVCLLGVYWQYHLPWCYGGRGSKMQSSWLVLPPCREKVQLLPVPKAALPPPLPLNLRWAFLPESLASENQACCKIRSNWNLIRGPRPITGTRQCAERTCKSVYYTCNSWTEVPSHPCMLQGQAEGFYKHNFEIIGYQA